MTLRVSGVMCVTLSCQHYTITALLRSNKVRPSLASTAHSSVQDTVRSAHNNRHRETETVTGTVAAVTEAYRRENQRSRMTGEELRTRNGDVEEEVMIVCVMCDV